MILNTASEFSDWIEGDISCVGIFNLHSDVGLLQTQYSLAVNQALHLWKGLSIYIDNPRKFTDTVEYHLE